MMGGDTRELSWVSGSDQYADKAKNQTECQDHDVENHEHADASDRAGFSLSVVDILIHVFTGKDVRQKTEGPEGYRHEENEYHEAPINNFLIFLFGFPDLLEVWKRSGWSRFRY